MSKPLFAFGPDGDWLTAVEAAFWGMISGVPLIIGAWVALHFKPSSRIVGMSMGFGAGALIGAIAYELNPSMATRDSYSFFFFFFGLGAVVFYLAVSLMDRRGAKAKDAKGGSGGPENGTSIVLGSFLDGIPESIVLGISLAVGGSVSISFLAAVFISNIPEGLGATSDLDKAGEAHRKIHLN